MNRRLGAQAELTLLQNVLDAPTLTLRERCTQLSLDHGITVAVSTLCKALHRLRISRQGLQHIALRRDEVKAKYFWMMIVTFYSMDELLVGDETAKCKGVMRRIRGYSPKGITPYQRDVVLTRGRRVSALCLLSCRGFEDWRFTNNTFRTASFQAASDDMLLTPDAQGVTLASRYRLLLLDNASIHKDMDYVRKLRCHIDVKFLPPYCYHLSPLDNGAFGYIVRMLQQHADYYATMTIENALSDVFAYVSPETARMCFHNCYG